MRYCEAVGCKNSSRSGNKMCHFPRSPTRRQKWIARVGRDGWEPKKYSTLCDAHFSEEMWENQSMIGRKKLKPLAVPNIFHRPAYVVPANVTEKVFNRSILKINVLQKSENNLRNFGDVCTMQIDVECNSNATVKEECEDTCESRTQNEEETNSDEIISQAVYEDACEPRTQNAPDNEQSCASCKDLKEKVRKLEILVRRGDRVVKIMKTQHKKQRKLLLMRINALAKKARINDALAANYSKLFNDDQLDMLTREYKRVPQWCDDTLIKSLKLKIACGKSGYKELLQQGYPMPSERTLRRKV